MEKLGGEISSETGPIKHRMGGLENSSVEHVATCSTIEKQHSSIT